MTVRSFDRQRKRKMTRELQIEQHLVRQAEKNNFIAWKWQSSRRGVPDRIVIGNGKVVFVELKAPNEKPTKQQEHVHGLLRAQGMEVQVIDSMEGVDLLMATMNREKDRLKSYLLDGTGDDA